MNKLRVSPLYCVIRAHGLATGCNLFIVIALGRNQKRPGLPEIDEAGCLVAQMSDHKTCGIFLTSMISTRD